MIVYDTPRVVVFRGRRRHTCHMASTLPGPEGTAELLDLARRIGMRAEWIQNHGTEKEHFDLFDRRITRARAAGARPITKRQFIRDVVWRKRGR